MTQLIQPGLRVVRGPDWKWGDQDGGEGSVGTLLETPASGKKMANTVVVQWDKGGRNFYRVRSNNEHDLRVFDSSPVGVCHKFFSCDGGCQKNIMGTRWHCGTCTDYDLCSSCYMSEKHDLEHPFIRFDMENSTGFQVPSRRQSVARIQAWGIFPDSVVVRGNHWKWSDQDGGENSKGKVLQVMKWKDTGGGDKDGVRVEWENGSGNNYRIGYKGNVDLKCLTASSGGFYYPDHLCIVGDENVKVSSFKKGDVVRVGLEKEIIQSMQANHGGWNEDMEKVSSFSIGNKVKICDDIDKVKELQEDHGGWVDSMTGSIGKIGRVVKINANGDAKVLCGKHAFVYNPICCTLIDEEADEAQNFPGEEESDSDEDPMEALTDLIIKLQLLRDVMEPTADMASQLIQAAAEGNIDLIRDLAQRSKGKIDESKQGTTALQAACHRGNREAVDVILAFGADVDLQDEDGFAPLHFAVQSGQADVVETLLKKGATSALPSKTGKTALHIATDNHSLACVQELLKAGCAVNCQDNSGYMPLHDAIGEGYHDIMESLLDHDGIDPALRNKRGFNALHLAARKNNVKATKKIAATCSESILNDQKEDGFSALHIAACNNHLEIVLVLLETGKVNIDCHTKKRQTPLHLAVQEGCTFVVEALLQNGAKIGAEDKDGDTCLHLALIMQTCQSELQPRNPDHVSLGIACYLVQNGADLHYVNHEGRTPLQGVTDKQTLQVLHSFLPNR